MNVSRAALRAEYEAASSGLGKFTSLKGFRSFLSLKTGTFDAITGLKAGLASSGARSAMLSRELPEVGNLESLANGGKDLAQNMKDIRALRALYGDDAQFAHLAGDWQRTIRLGQVAVGTGQGIDLTNMRSPSRRSPA